MEIAKGADSSKIVDESSPGQHKPQQEAVSEMGLVSTETKAEHFVTIDMPPIVNSTPQKFSILDSSAAVYEVGSFSGCRPISEYQTGTLTMEDVAILALGDSQSHQIKKQKVAINRATSLPSILSQPLLPKGIGRYKPIYRSHSVPVSYTHVTMTEDHVRVLRVIPNGTSTDRIAGLLSPEATVTDDQDAITEEEAVCRICFEELGEEHTFRLECNCRGDLALVHRHCSQRWFNTRGTRTCEICGKRVRNVTVRIVRRINTSIWNHFQPQPVTYTDIIWHGILLLFMVSMMAYTLSIELIKLRRSSEYTNEPYGSVSAAIVLALFTSVTALVVGQWKDAWIYALAQYVVFTVFAEFFYDLCRLGPIPTLFLATFFAVGIGRGAEPAYLGIKKWRETRLNQVNSNSQEAVLLHIESEPTDSLDVNQHESNEETAENHQLDENPLTAESHHSDLESIEKM